MGESGMLVEYGALLALLLLLAGYRVHWLRRAIRLRRVRDKVRDSEALYRQLTEDISDVIWKTDRNLYITYISPVDERLRGYRSDEVIGHHVFEMFTDEGIATVKKLMQRRQKSDLHGEQTGSIPFEAQHRCKDGRLLWAEVLARPERDALGAITGYHGITREITERKTLQDKVRQMAFHDPLTGLANRRLLSDRLRQTLATGKRSGCHGALMFLDLDNFKPLNDTHGHVAGDLLLIEVAIRLKNCVREVDTVARIGGDEFVAMLGDLNPCHAMATKQALFVAEKMRQALAHPYLLTISRDSVDDALVEHHCTASIGLVVFGGNTAGADDIVKQADIAMYAAKAAGRNLIRMHGPVVPVSTLAGEAAVA